jgi:hypothetical protein
MLSTEEINQEYISNILDRIAIALHGRYALRVLNNSNDEVISLLLGIVWLKVKENL